MTAVLLAGSLACAVGYLVTAELGDYPGRVLVKGGGVALLAAAVLWRVWAGPADLLWLVAALTLSVAGDCLLVYESRFRAGLVAFLLAHLSYLGLFWLGIGTGHFGWIAIAGSAAVVVAGVVLLASLWRELGSMRAPVGVYVVVIGAMAISALGTGSAWLSAGALAFVSSDVLIAVNKFSKRLPRSRRLNWILYYGGQVSLAAGALHASGIRLFPW